MKDMWKKCEERRK